ncbi:hypothetical protein BZA77DRAFT_257265 [Pyronema omphalodes]|nr:hypothetical protein BZA77DRAFT_257265 [Pyronema omphalodes]
MSKATLGLIAAAGAATGAAATALFYNSRGQTAPTASPAVASAVAAGAAAGVAAATTVAANNRTAPAPAPQQRRSDVPVNPAGFFQYGFPGPVNDVAARAGLVSGYDRRTRNPAWVVEHITPESLAMKEGDRKNSQFVEDEAIPEMFRAKMNDYRGSGYDRGHQVPAADCKFSQQAMDDTFFLSNMCPQVGQGFNRDYWSHFEDFCRRLTQKYPSVRIVTGPLYLPKQHPDGKWRVSYEVIGNPPNVAVPTHFYKVILAEGKDANAPVAVGAFILPNAVISNKTQLTDFQVPVEIVERASGLEFLKLLPANKKKELCKEIECSLIIKEFNNSRKGKN